MSAQDRKQIDAAVKKLAQSLKRGDDEPPLDALVTLAATVLKDLNRIADAMEKRA